MQNIFLGKHLWVTASVYMEVNTTDASRYSLVQSKYRKTRARSNFSRVELTLLHGCSPINRLNAEHLSWKTPLGDCFCIYGSEYNRCQPVFPCSE